jgi:hypothetical protein
MPRILYAATGNDSRCLRTRVDGSLFICAGIRWD